MNIYKIIQIIAVLISILGVSYIGYCNGKGIEDKYGLGIVIFGLLLNIVGLFMGKRKKSSEA